MKQLLIACLACGVSMGFAGPAHLPTSGELFNRADALFVPTVTEEFAVERLKMTHVSRAKARPTDGAARTFEATQREVLLAWGNYEGKLAPSEQVELWPRFTLRFQCRRTTPGAVIVNFRPWGEGKRDGRPGGSKYGMYTHAVKGPEWEEVAFDVNRFAAPDGFELACRLTGAWQGACLEIKDMSITRRFRRGAFVKDVMLPEGKIWRAVVDLNNMSLLHINGVEVQDTSPIMPRPAPARFMYRSRWMDIAPYLKAGRNRICLFGERAFVGLRGSVIMTSGERILVDSHDDWKWNGSPPHNWTTADFDVSAWPAVTDRVEGGGAKARPEAVAGPMTMYGFSYRMAGAQPAYDGLMALRHPHAAKLFYTSDQDVLLDVEVPNGFRDRTPRITWLIERYRDGDTEKEKSGQVNHGAFRKASLRFRVNAGRLSGGVYLFSSTLTLDGKAVEVRPAEPFVVTDRIPMQEVSGSSYEQGMDLELEDTIDFTNPDDTGHPWMETDARGRYPGKNAPWTDAFARPVTDPIVVERNGLRYRETRPRHEAQFSYRVSFEHPGDWYLMVLDYPDDRERWMGVSCSTAMRMHDPEARGIYRGDEVAKCGPSIWTGLKYPNSGTMQEMKWLYRPDPGFHAINVISLGKHMAAAAARLRMYHVKGRLPALRSTAPAKDERLIGLLSERTFPSNGFSSTFSVRKHKKHSSRGFDKARADYVPALWACASLEEFLDTCEAYTEYLRFTGQNLHVMGCFQYNDKNTCFMPTSGSARIPFDLRDVAAHVFDANGIRFFGSIEFTHTFGLLRKAAEYRERTGDSYSPFCLVSRDGLQGVGPRGTAAKENWNFIHPDVEAEMLDVAEEVAKKFKTLPGFLGVNWTAFFGGGWIPSYRTRDDEPFQMGYGDVTINAFEQDTGIEVPGAPDDPDRFAERYAFLMSPAMKPFWSQWRCERMRDFFAKMARRIQKHRIDLECSAGCYLNAALHGGEWLHSGKPFDRYLAEWGWDRELFAEAPALWLTAWLGAAAHCRPSHRAEEYAMSWEINVSPEFYRSFDMGPHRSVMLNYGWYEVERVTALMPRKPEWPRPYQSTMQVQQAGDFAREPYVQAMVGLDPNTLMFGFTDASLYIGQEQRLRSFARVFRALPLDKFEPYGKTGFRTNFAIRHAKRGGKLYFYVVNPGYWPIQGAVLLDGAASVTDLAEGTPASVTSMQDGLAVRVELAPFGIAAFAAEGADARLTSWTHEPLGNESLAHMRAIIADAREAAEIPGFEEFLGEASFGLLGKTADSAETAIKTGQYALAWSLLTDGEFWTVVYQKAGDMRTADLTRRKSFTLPKTMTAPKVDGKLIDLAWRRVEPLGGFVTSERTVAPYETFVYTCHDGETLYIAFDCRDRQPDKIQAIAKEEREIFASADDVVDVFFYPNMSGQNYYQLAVNSGGIRFDQECAAGKRNYGYTPDWKARAVVGEQGWTLEMSIPARALEATLEPGARWGINFHRQFRDKQHPVSSWSYSPRWHDLERMAEMTVGE